MKKTILATLVILGTTYSCKKEELKDNSQTTGLYSFTTQQSQAILELQNLGQQAYKSNSDDYLFHPNNPLSNVGFEHNQHLVYLEGQLPRILNTSTLNCDLNNDGVSENYNSKFAKILSLSTEHRRTVYGEPVSINLNYQKPQEIQDYALDLKYAEAISSLNGYGVNFTPFESQFLLTYLNGLTTMRSVNRAIEYTFNVETIISQKELFTSENEKLVQGFLSIMKHSLVYWSLEYKSDNSNWPYIVSMKSEINADSDDIALGKFWRWLGIASADAFGFITVGATGTLITGLGGIGTGIVVGGALSAAVGAM